MRVSVVIFSVTFSRRRNIVRHPTRQSQSGVLYYLCSQHRVINTAEFHTNYQYHRQLFLCYPICKVKVSESGVNQPPAPSTNTQSACCSSARNPALITNDSIGLPSCALMMCGEVGSAKV